MSITTQHLPHPGHYPSSKTPHPTQKRLRANTLTKKPPSFPTHHPRPSLPTAVRIPRGRQSLASTDDTPPHPSETFHTSLPALRPLHSLPEPTHIPLHPDFASHGDVILICPSDHEQVGFRVQSSRLRTTCDLFATLGDPEQPLETDGRVYLDDPAAEIHTFLCYLQTEVPLDFSLAECFAISRLLTRYGAHPSTRLLLKGYIFRNAGVLVASLGPSPPKEYLLHLLAFAVEWKSTEIWHWVIAHIRHGWWRALLNPRAMGAAEEAVVGRSGMNALRYIAEFGEGEMWGGIEGCGVARDPNGLFFIIRRSGGGQLVYSDTAL